MYREDMRQFFTGMGRIYLVVTETFEILNLVRKSENWVTEFNRLKQINPVKFGAHAYMTYQEVSQLYAAGDFEGAGQALALGIFPEQEAHTGSLTWPKLPYEPDFEGQEIAGITAGLIYRFTGEENYDSLSLCLSDQEGLTESMKDVVDTMMDRYNQDIIDSVHKFEEIVKVID